MKREKGFTLIELLVTLGLSGIIISIVMSFFIMNLKNYESISNDTELQFQALYILNFMTNKIIGSKNIELIKGDRNFMDENTEQEISKISFRYGETNNHCYVFSVGSNKINYYNGYYDSNYKDELGVYVKKLYVEPLNNKKFQDADTIIIRIALEKNNLNYEAKQTIHMRNHILK